MLDIYLYIVLVTLSVAVTGSYVNTNIIINNKIKETNDNMVTKINDSIKQLENIDIIQLQNYQSIIDRITAGSININSQIQQLENDINRLDNNENLNGSIANNIKTALIPINDKINTLNGPNTTLGSVSNIVNTITNPQFVDLTTKTNTLTNKMDILNGTSTGSILKMIDESIVGIKNDIIKLNGNSATNGSISKMIDDSIFNIKNDIIKLNGGISNQGSVLNNIQLVINNLNLVGKIDGNINQINTLNGGISTPGSVSNSISNFVTPLINTVNTEINNLKTIPTGGCIDNYIFGAFSFNRIPNSTEGTRFNIPKRGTYVLNICASAMSYSVSMIRLEVFIDGTKTYKDLRVWSNYPGSHTTLIPLSFKYTLTQGTHYLFLSHITGYSDSNDFASFNWVFESE
jgi:hypothetical protein